MHPADFSTPYLTEKRRSEEGKILRRQFHGDKGCPYSACKRWTVIRPAISGALTTFTTDRFLVFISTDKQQEEMTHYENPTDEQLADFYERRVDVRKFSPRECLRLMAFSERSIDAFIGAKVIHRTKSGSKEKPMPKTQLYKQAGNSIVTECIYHIGRTLWCRNQPEYAPAPGELPLFD